VGFEPTTPNLGEYISMDWNGFRTFLQRKYSKEYASANLNYSRRFFECYHNPSELQNLPTSNRANVVKALIALSKFQGKYLEFKERLKQHGIKWLKPDNLTAFLNILNNRQDDLAEWYRYTQNILDERYRLFLRFVLLSGLRKGEAFKSHNMIVELARQNRLSEYYDIRSSILQHFKFNHDFLRRTKNVYISILPNTLIHQIANSEPVTYASIHKFLERRHTKLRLRELRSYYATYLRKHGIISELVDLIQGRIGKDVFIRHYLKENPENLSIQVLELLKGLENSMQPEQTLT
jgi:intergrase/recombinase